MKLSLALVVCSLIRIDAAQAPDPVVKSDHEVIQELLARVQQLEAELRQLKSQPAQPVPRPPSEASRAPDPAPAQAAAQAAPPPEPMEMMNPSAGTPTMQIRGFSDVQYRASDQRGGTNGFALGQFNLFLTSKVTDKLSVLAEVVMEADTQTNAVGIDLERLLVGYAFNDYFNVSLGRYHTAIGYYNTAYHHSTWMQTALDRPFLFAFEDEGGILPIHNVGITANGRVPSGRLGLHYVAELGNGRAHRSPLDEAVQNVRDENNGKAVNLQVFARPDWAQNLRFGASFYHDRLTPAGLAKYDESILAVHANYNSRTFEFLNEALVLRHAARGESRATRTPGFYTQFSRRFGLLRPYFRYQYVNAPGRDPFVGDVGLLHGPSVGLRYDFSEFAAVKFQYDRFWRNGLGAVNGIASQVSFVF